MTLDLDLGVPKGEIGLLCAQASLDDPVYREFIEALRITAQAPQAAVTA